MNHPTPSSAEAVDTAAVRHYLQGLQQRIVAGLESVDGGSFATDAWERAEGGGGISRVIEDSHVFERAGVLFSHVTGNHLPPTASATRPGMAGRSFEAMGVSLVLHPRNPHVPTVHLNVRCFIAAPRAGAAPDSPDGMPVWWFGGGMDLTPYYGVDEDVVHFHATCKSALAPFGPDYHPRFKKACDQYFFLKHRGEARGIGGIFFDDFSVMSSSIWSSTAEPSSGFSRAGEPNRSWSRCHRL